MRLEEGMAVPATVTGMHIWKSIDTRDNDLVRLTM